VPVSVEQRPHALRELRLCLFDILPRRHTLMIAPVTGGMGKLYRQLHRHFMCGSGKGPGPSCRVRRSGEVARLAG
jgi:hypothetical protein